MMMAERGTRGMESEENGMRWKHNIREVETGIATWRLLNDVRGYERKNCAHKHWSAQRKRDGREI